MSKVKVLVHLKAVLIVLFAICILSSPTALAVTEIVDIVSPPSDLGDFQKGSVVTLIFSASIVDAATGSMAVITLDYPTGGFSYQGFSAMMGTTDVSSQFSVSEPSGAGSLKVECSSISPMNGVLDVELELLADGSLGTYSFDWLYYYTAFPSIPGTPVLQKSSGSSQVEVTSVELGTDKDVYEIDETVYLSGGDFLSDGSYALYIVEDADWVGGEDLSGLSRYGETSVDVTGGTVDNELIWGPPLIEGAYDVIVDVDDDGEFATDKDEICGLSVAGFHVIPEVPFGTVIASTAAFIGLYVWKKRSAM